MQEGHTGVGGHNHFVARADAQRQQRQVQGGGSRTRGHAPPAAHAGSHALLELLDLLPLREMARAHHTGNRREVLDAKRRPGMRDHNTTRWHSKASAASTAISAPRRRARRSTFSRLPGSGAGRSWDLWNARASSLASRYLEMST